MAKLTIRDIDVRGKRVFMRVDFNVPLEEKEGVMVVTDVTRIKETLPSINYLIEKGAKLILASHLGRPKGKDPTASLKPVAAKLQEMLGRPVTFIEDCTGPEVEKAVNNLKEGDILVLENTRFYKEEEANDLEFSKKLAAFADIYVNDAFGSAHRAHASTEGVARVVASKGGSCVAGFLMERELKFLGDELENPKKPFIVILGGAKVSDKINVIDRLLDRADALLIGGAMVYTFRLSMGHKTGKSLVEPDKTDVAKKALEKAKAKNVQFLLPVDDVIAKPVPTDKLDKKGKPVIDYQDVKVNSSLDCPEGYAGLDIGPKTIKQYSEIIAGAKTILWNGPMGLFENKLFAAGTNAIAKAVADATQNGAKSIIGGGDSVKALNKAGLADKVTFVSTGGGASLEFLEGKVLPGVAALMDKPAGCCCG
ncbi:MAG: phosphoglycerate kinase [Verrucomicrobiia bacterium]